MAVYMGRTVALCGNSSMYALHEQSMETRHGDWSETITAKKGFKDRDHDQYHANTSGFTGVVFAHTTPGNPASVAASFGYRLCLL